MKKASKMLSIEESLGEPVGEYLRREYVDNGKSSTEIAGDFEVNRATIGRWLKNEGIEMRSISESKLPKDFVMPSKGELRKMYVDERMSAAEIGITFGASKTSIRNWFKKEGIKMRSLSESGLPKDFVKPSGEELERMYVDERMSTYRIAEDLGVANVTVGNWLKDEGISVRSSSEAGLSKGVTKPPKEELERMYVDERRSTLTIARNLGVADVTVGSWLKGYGIPVRGAERITIRKQFLDFLQEDKTARNLAATALALNGEAYDIEQIILETYEGKFRDQSHLHALLEESEQEIYWLIQEGLTNLGTYIGKFSLEDRSIIPMLLGEAIMSLPEEKVTPSLEERLVRILRNQYSPRFNTDSEGTLLEIEERVEGTEGKARNLYEGLREHYQSVLELQEELR